MTGEPFAEPEVFMYVVPEDPEQVRRFVFTAVALDATDTFELRTGLRMADVLRDAEDQLCEDEKVLIAAAKMSVGPPSYVVEDDIATITIAVPDASYWPAVQDAIVGGIADARGVDASAVQVHDLTKDA